MSATTDKSGNPRLSICTSDYSSDISSEAVSEAIEEQKIINAKLSESTVKSTPKLVSFSQTVKVGLAPAYDRTVKVYLSSFKSNKFIVDMFSFWLLVPIYDHH